MGATGEGGLADVDGVGEGLVVAGVDGLAGVLGLGGVEVLGDLTEDLDDLPALAEGADGDLTEVEVGRGQVVA